MTFASTAPFQDIDSQFDIANDRGWVVIVYDNDSNTFEEVITILVLATACSLEEAKIEAWEVHHLGHSTVHCASESECQRVAEIIRQIGIRVEVRKDD